VYYYLSNFKIDLVLKVQRKEAEGLMLQRLDNTWMNKTKVSKTDFVELEGLGMIRSEFIMLL
jgi:hypothetical protein